MNTFSNTQYQTCDALKAQTPSILIAVDDVVFTNASCYGKEEICCRFTGFSSYTDLLKAVKKATSSLRGIVSVKLRNSTQGWNKTMTLYNRA